MVRGFNVSPSSMVEGKRSRANDDAGSLNSSRMTGTQELSIHEGMQVMHEMENQHNKKNVKGQKKKKKTNDCSEVVFNLGSLNTDNLKNPDNSLADQSKAEQQDIDIDDNIVQYTIEQFLDENADGESELRNYNKASSRLEKKSNTGAASNRSSNRHGNLFQVGTTSKNSVVSANSKNKIAVHEFTTQNENGEYTNYRIAKDSGSRPSSSTNKHNNLNSNKSQKELPMQAMAHNMKVQLYHCLKTHNLNYLTAAYYLTQKHEFS